MSQERKEFLARKEKVISNLDRAIRFLRQNDFEKEADILSAQCNNVKNEEFVITIVGEFSTGKSYLFNALIGEKLLPSYSGEATAAINFLRHKEKAENGEGGRVYYKDGRVVSFETADQKTIEKYASTRSEEVTDIDHLDVFIDSKFLKDNVTLVDTPGLNGLRSGLGDMTRQQIEKSSASIFLFNSRQPGSETDFEALNMLRKRVNSIFLVLTQTDLIDQSKNESVESVIKSLEDKYHKDYPDDKRLTRFHPVSAKMALVGRSSSKIELFGRTDFTAEEKKRLVEQSGMPEFEEYLFGYLTKGEKGRQMLLGPVGQLKKQLENANNSIEAEEDLLNGKVDVQQLDEECKKLEDAIASLNKQVEAKGEQIKNIVKEAESEFNEAIVAEADTLETRYRNKTENFTDIDEIDPETIKKGLLRGLKQSLEQAFDSYRDRVGEGLDSLNAEMNDELKRLLDFDDFEEPPIGELTLTVLDSKIDEFERQISQLHQESEELRRKLEDAEEGTYEARKIAMEISSCKRKIEKTESDKAEYKKIATINMPAVITTKKSEQVYVERDGILGKFLDVVVGRSKETKFTDVVDSSAKDAYLEDMKRITRDYDEEIAKLKAELAKHGDADPEKAERIENRLREKYQEKRRRELELQKEFAEKIKKLCAVQLQKQKEEITDWVNASVRALKDYAKKYFRGIKNTAEKVSTDLVTRSLKEAIEEKNREIDDIRRRAFSLEKDHDKRLAELAALKKELREMRLAALDLWDDLDSISEFVIE